MFEEHEEQRAKAASAGSEKDGPSGAVAPAEAEQPGPSPEGCPVKMWSRKPCGRPPLGPRIDGISYCLMHIPSGKDDAAFQEEFERILSEAGDGVADFTHFVFPSADYSGRTFKATCRFSRATFAQKADFQGATFTQHAHFMLATFTQADFIGATFAQNADFIGAKFTQDAYFMEATFTKNGDFTGAKFTQNANFGGATFTQDADFTHATFNQDVEFFDATLTQKALFGEATFSGHAAFSTANFKKDANFVRAAFEKDADFSRATFAQKARFIRAKFGGIVEFRETNFRNDDEPLPGPVFSLAAFSEPEKVTFYKTYLGQALFHNCDVSKVNFSSVEWRRRNGKRKRMVFEEVVHLGDPYDTEGLKPKQDSPDERDYGLIAELYQQLKKNYDERKDYWTAGDFHYGELEMKRLAWKRRNKALRWLVQHLRLVALYKYASHYGESYVRPALWFGATLLVFALLFPKFGLRYDAAKNRASVAASSSASAPPSADIFVLSYANPFFPGQAGSYRHKAQLRLFGNSLLTALEVAAFQKEPAYQPVYPWGRFLTLFEMLLTSTFAGLFFLAVRRQFRR